jgi:uncharacterized protein
MALLEKQLIVKRSTIPGAGKGLFTTKDIAKGKCIVEYKGVHTTWKAVSEEDRNGYIYYINRNHVIDAKLLVKTFGRYANDANGLLKVPGIANNARYVVDGKMVFIVAAKNISAGEEILVRYGKEYWDVIRHNMRLDKPKSSGKS